MSENATASYQRRVTPVERLFTRSPFSIVTVVARIRGEVTEPMLRQAVGRVRERHPNLRVRLREEANHSLWLTSENADEIPVEVVPRESDGQWIEVHQAASQVPFEFEERPAIRFILLQSPAVSDLIILCHHILCDGLSLAYLARDLLLHLGDPARPAAPLPDPTPIDRDNLPGKTAPAGIVRFFMNRINKRWQAEHVTFDQDDYRALNAAYWSHFTHRIVSLEWTAEQTQALVERCRREKVTVNSALAAAFAGAQQLVRGAQPELASVGVAASLRDRLPVPAGETMGFYAGVVTPKFTMDAGKSFWENARRFHQQVGPLLTDKNLFREFVAWCQLDPTILEAINFKKLGGLVPAGDPRHEKLTAFAARDDTVLSILRRDKMESLDRLMMGLAVTNLGRLEFPTRYGPLELDRLIMQPGGAFPLANVGLVLGAATCAGKLSLVLEYAQETVDPATVARIQETAVAALQND